MNHDEVKEPAQAASAANRRSHLAPGGLPVWARQFNLRTMPSLAAPRTSAANSACSCCDCAQALGEVGGQAPCHGELRARCAATCCCSAEQGLAAPAADFD